MTAPIITGGTINGATIGATTASTGKFTAVTNSALTSGRVTYAGTAGVLQDDADFTFNGTTVTMANDASISGLTVGKGGGAVAGNTAVGNGALSTNSSGIELTALGYNALSANTGNANTAVGERSLAANTTGIKNTATGSYCLAVNTTGSSNVAYGRETLSTNTTGSNNTAFGQAALQFNTTASSNTAVGYTALYSNTTGANNVAIGLAALTANTTASNNTAVGYQAAYALTTGANNTFIGLSAGYGTPVGAPDITTGSNNVYIGGYSAPSASANTYEIVIGYNSTGKGTGTGFMNAGGGGNYAGNNSASWSTISDKRIKKNIVDNNIGLEKIMQIQVRNFEYRKPEEVSELPSHLAIDKDGMQLGVIAQELQQILPKCVKEESTGFLSVDSSDLTWYLINAVKELKAEVDSLKAQLNNGA